MSLYNDVLCDFINIMDAYRKAHKQKTNDKRVVEFDSNKIYNLHRLQRLMKNKEWGSVFKYYTFKIHEPKERIIDALEFEGRIIQHVLCDKILKPYFEKRLVSRNCACRERKGTTYAINMLKQNMIRHVEKHGTNGYILKMDIKKYFPSINREILKNKLSIFPDKEIRELLYYIVDSAPNDYGIPIGNQSSQWFALYYLNDFDRIIIEKYSLTESVRYVDDCITMCDSLEKLKMLKKELDSYLRNSLGLMFNPKTHICRFTDGVSFLGWKYKPRKNNRIVMTISRDKSADRKKTIRRVKKMFYDNKITTTDYLGRIQTIRDNLNNGDTYEYQLRRGILYTRDYSRRFIL